MLMILSLVAVSASAEPAASTGSPNIVLILADDLGFTDLGAYGSEINTPTLDALARDGLLFANHHTPASCAPSRAMLLTGVDSHRAGVPNIPEMIPPDQKDQAHYQGVLGRNVVTLATLLQDRGYHTYIAGKWHLGSRPGELPSQRGFERTFILADSGADNWEQKPYLPIYEKANWFSDGQEAELPEDFYSSTFLTDQTIDFIQSQRGDGRPFFAYLPFQAVHIPVQAPQEFIDRYDGVYDVGWDSIREARHREAQRLGVIPAESQRVRMATTEDWDALTPEDQRYQAKRMAVYAGMVEAMDFNIGRLIDYLKQAGLYENTIILFTSDNGAEASGQPNQGNLPSRLAASAQGYRTDYEDLGLKGSFNAIPPSFASAAVSPLAYYKFYAGEGGMRVPLIISGERLGGRGQTTEAFTYVSDLAPTILELTGTPAPGRYRGGRAVEPMQGRSVVPLVSNPRGEIHPSDESIGYELAGNAALFRGNYKIVFNRGPTGDDRWHLYNLAVDPGETLDLAAREPALFQEMLGEYERYVVANQVLPVPADYNPQAQVLLNGLHARGAQGVLLGVLLLAVTLPFVLFYRARNKSGQSGSAV